MKFALPLFLLRFVRSAECLSMPIREASQMPRRKLLEDSVLSWYSARRRPSCQQPWHVLRMTTSTIIQICRRRLRKDVRLGCVLFQTLPNWYHFKKWPAGLVVLRVAEVRYHVQFRLDQQHQLRPTMNTNAEHCAKLATGMGSFFKNRWPNFKKRYCVQFWMATSRMLLWRRSKCKRPIPTRHVHIPDLI